MSNIAFKVSKRNLDSSRNSLKKIGQIPGIIYGEFLEKNIPFQFSENDLPKLFQTNNHGSVLTLELDGKELPCVIKEIQRDNFYKILHVDLQYVKPNEIIKMKVPVSFIGEEALTPKNLILETFNPFLEIQGTADQIPEYLEYNVSDMNYEDKVYVEDIKIPENVTVLNGDKTLLAVANS